MNKLTTKEFIKRSNKIHNNKYNYSLVDYVNSYTKIIIICKKHNQFLQAPNSHLKGYGCKQCGSYKQRLTTKNFIRQANKIHNNKYNYSLVNYTNNKIKIIIICKKHNKFLQIPYAHLLGQGCKQCNIDKQKLTTQQFINKANKIHNNKYNYSLVNYINVKTKITIICKKHGEFLQTPNHHLKNRGCPNCSSKISKLGTKWLDKIEKQLGYNLKREYYIGIGKYSVDGFDQKTNTCYEYNGIFWHGHPNYYNSNDIHPITKTTYGELYQKTLKREKLIRSAGYNLIIKWGK